MFTLNKKFSFRLSDSTAEKWSLLMALFFLAFGLGLIFDGSKLYSRQQKLAQRIDYKATLNPFANSGTF
jgi:hypothetical protein